MRKNKYRKKHFYSVRFLARLFVLNIPTALVLSIMLFWGKIGPWTAMIFFGCVLIVTGVITSFVFKELESFIGYLKNLAQGLEVETPRFHKGIFGSFRLADAFLKVKNIWSNQTLSDARILEILPVPLLLINLESKIVSTNKIAEDFFGADCLGKSINQIITVPFFENILNQIIQRSKQNDWFEWEYKDDVTYTFQVRIERLPELAKNKAIAVIVFHDITTLTSFKQQQDDFFANASHELKTPLSILSGVIETLQGPAKEDEIAREKFLNMMAEQTKRMTHLVQNLLEVSKLKMIQKTKSNDVILVSELLTHVLEDLTIKAQNNHKTLQLKLVHDLPRLIGNQALLHQAFQNLVDNAIKYGEEGKPITIKAQLCNGFPKKSDRYFEDIRQVILVSVHNFGNPIPSSVLPRIFERFYRIDSFKTKSIEGTGLGLGITQQIIQQHDGLIEVSSTEKKGTTFSVYLPVDF